MCELCEKGTSSEERGMQATATREMAAAVLTCSAILQESVSNSTERCAGCTRGRDARYCIEERDIKTRVKEATPSTNSSSREASVLTRSASTPHQLGTSRHCNKSAPVSGELKTWRRGKQCRGTQRQMRGVLRRGITAHPELQYGAAPHSHQV